MRVGPAVSGVFWQGRQKRGYTDVLAPEVGIALPLRSQEFKGCLTNGESRQLQNVATAARGKPSGRLDFYSAVFKFRNLAKRIERLVGQQICRSLVVAKRNKNLTRLETTINTSGSRYFTAT